jgi:predicted DNA-binding transcriptional regulator YafY
MYNPATRLLTILELLQSHPELSGQELAGRLEVDPRTVRRYVMMLQDMGIPIEAERGRYGGYHLRPGFKLPPLMFTEEEGLAVTFGLMVTRQLGLGVPAAAMEGAIAKMERVMPDILRQRTQALQEALLVELPRPRAIPPPGEIVMALSMAVQQTQQVWLQHQNRNGEETERHFDPYALVYRAGYWYTVGYCHLRQDLRTFRIDRILQVNLTPQTFTRPADFDPLKQVERSIANTPGVWAADILLLTTLETAQQLVPPALATLEAVPEGVRLHCQVQSLDWFAHFLAGLDCPWQVNSPPELHEAIQRLATRIIDYSSSTLG